MSLLDDVSIVVTPNGYKAGELYAVVPVPTEGSEEVTNGDFATDTDWTKGTGWTIGSGLLSCDGTQTGVSQVYQFGVITLGTRYQITFTLSNYSSGTIRVGADGSWGSYYSANGTYTYDITSAGTLFIIQANSTFVGSIDNVSVKEYTSADMDVTRATAATRVDENGLVNYAEVLGAEEVIDGNFPTPNTAWAEGGDWEISGGVASTVGTTKAPLTQDCLINGLNRLTFTLISGEVSVYTQYPSFGARNSYTIAGTYTIDLSNETNPRLYFYNKEAGTPASISNISVKEVTRDNVPRIDYTGGGCPHILAEPQRTNLITYSEDFSQSYWSKLDGLTVSSLAGGLSPDGLTNSDLITINNGRLNKDISVSNSTDYTLSVYFKGTVGETLNMDLGASTKVVTLTGLWQRESLNLTTTSTFIAINLIDNRSSGTSSTVEIWGTQLEVGSYPTSYIPTSGSTVTRNQDIFTRDGIGSLINSEEGVLFVEMAALTITNSSNAAISVSDGSTTNRIFMYYSAVTNAIKFQAIVGGSTAAFMQYTLTDITIQQKIAFKWDGTTFSVFIDGDLKGSDDRGLSFPSGTLNTLGLNRGSAAEYFVGKVKQLQVYDTALTDDQLRKITQ